MKFHGIPEDLLAGKARVRVLRILSKHPGKGFSGREIARLCRLSPRSASQALKLFEEYGIVERTRVGGTDSWKINISNIIVGVVSEFLESIFGLEEKALKKLENEIVKTLGRQREVKRIVLYGSVARGTERPGSDVDLFVLVENKKNKKKVIGLVNELSLRLARAYGNHVSPLIYTERELQKNRELQVIKNIEMEGRTIFER
jgi:predicted nucleotidyltransferase